jgi:hypothetical protein
MAYSQTTVSPWAHGIAVFAGVMLIVGGAFQAIQAFAAIVNDKYLVVLEDYVYAFDLTLWGWLHLLIGLGLLAVGVFLLRGETWARVAGMILAAIAIIVNFAWLPHAPWWSVLAIAVDVLVIWALATYLRQPDRQPSPDATATAS